MIRIVDLNTINGDELFKRNPDDSGVSDIVKEIIREVRTDGDEALKRFAARFDGCAPDCLEVSEEEIDAAFAAADPHMIEVLEKAAANISAFHRHQVRNSFVINEQDGTNPWA